MDVMGMSLEEVVKVTQEATRSRGGGRGRRGGRGRGRGAGGDYADARREASDGDASREPTGGRRRGGRGGRRGGGGGGRYGAGAGAGGMGGEAPVGVKVGSSSDPKTVAGAIARNIRVGAYPSVHAIGAAAINQAFKSLIVCRAYLEEEGLDFRVQAVLHSETGTDAVEFALSRLSKRSSDILPDASLLRVSSSGGAASVAGAIAGKIREGERVACTGVGADAVKIIVKAVALSGSYLEEDGFEVYLKGSFIKIEAEDGSERTAVRADILTAQL